MYLYTRFSGRANPLIKQVFLCLLSSGFSLTFCPGGNLIIHLQLKEITDCWEWVDAFHLPWKFFVFWFIFFFLSNSVSKLSSGKKYSESLHLREGQDSFPTGFVFYRFSHSDSGCLVAFLLPSHPISSLLHHCIFIFHSFYVPATCFSLTLLSVITPF